MLGRRISAWLATQSEDPRGRDPWQGGRFTSSLGAEETPQGVEQSTSTSGVAPAPHVPETFALSPDRLGYRKSAAEDAEANAAAERLRDPESVSMLRTFS